MLLNNFPDLSKHTHNHNNSLIGNYDACVFIPYGPKCYIWFTTIDNDSKCILITIQKDRTISNASVIKMRFHNDLALGNGTIFYCVKTSERNLVIEDILMYKGKDMQTPFIQKLQAYKTFFSKEYQYDTYNQVNISLAWIRNNIKDEDVFLKIPYDVYALKYYTLSSNKYRVILSKNDTENSKIKYTFIVKKKDKCELYELYILNKDNKPIIYDYALINDLITSKKMKDAFENKKEDTLIFKCIYNKKYKGWVPMNIVNHSNIRISNVNELRKYPSNNF